MIAPSGRAKNFALDMLADIQADKDNPAENMA
jgi:hypothetical protein